MSLDRSERRHYAGNLEILNHVTAVRCVRTTRSAREAAPKSTLPKIIREQLPSGKVAVVLRNDDYEPTGRRRKAYLDSQLDDAMHRRDA